MSSEYEGLPGTYDGLPGTVKSEATARWRRRGEMANQEVAELRAKIKELRERLRANEWLSGSHDPDYRFCLGCWKVADDFDNPKHTADCWLKAEINQLEPEDAP